MQIPDLVSQLLLVLAEGEGDVEKLKVISGLKRIYVMIVTLPNTWMGEQVL